MKHKIAINKDYGGFSLSDEAIKWLKAHGKEFDDLEDIKRHDPLLIECIETLGKKANGSCADIAIKEIDSNWYRIQEYDGIEWIETPESIDWEIIPPGRVFLQE